jgi:predicted dehydrogenase
MLQVGMVGLGYWGPSLLRALFDLPSVQVKWICDRDPERLARYERRYPGILSTLRIDDILEDDAVDAVVIATPVYTHFYLASRALHAGKHAFVEKPLAASSREADELVRVAESRGLALMCGHTFIYSPAVRAVRTMLEQGELGELFFVSSSRVNLGLHQQDISVIWDLGPHDFSMLLYWLDEMPEKVRAVGRDSIVKGISDVAFVTLDFPSGLLANVELSWLAPSKLRRTVIVGSERMVVYDDGSTEPIKVFNHGVVYQDPETFGEYHLSYRTGDIVSPKIDAAEPILLELADFAAAVEAHEAPVGHLELARNVARLTEAAEESLRTGGDVSLRGRTRFAELIEPRGE